MRCRVSYHRLRSHAALLLMVLLTYLCSNTLFIHTHLFNDKVVSHSHFHTGSADNPEHGHSQSQILHLQLLSHIDALEVGVMVLLAAATFECGLILEGAYNIICRKLLFTSLRAPPVSI